MAYHYNDIERLKTSYIDGYEVGWDIPVRLAEDFKDKYKYNKIRMITDAVNIGYCLGLDAQKHAAEVPSTDPRRAQDVPGKP